MIPVMNRNSVYKLTIPDMAGGVNLRDGLSLVNDNQMTECENVWYKDGMLKTRPRVLSNDDREKMDELSFSLDEYGSNVISVDSNPNNTRTINGKTYVLEVITITSNGSIPGCAQSVDLKYVNGDDVIRVATIDFRHDFDTVYSNLSCFVVQYNGDIYVYSKITVDGETINAIYLIEEESEGVFKEPIIKDGKIPLIITNGYPKLVADTEEVPRGTQVEGFNLLSKDYKQIMSTYDYENPSNYCMMEYALMVDINTQEFDGRKITATITHKNGATVTHSATIRFDPITETYTAWEIPLSEEETTETADSLKMHVSGKTLRFYIYDPEFPEDVRGATATLDQYDYVKNNLEIIAPCYSDSEYQKNFVKVTSMTKTEWYGNTSLGLNGGSRLFLGGSTQKENEALVIWSDFDNPLYFSENNYAYVGDKAQRVTTFGRQGSSLIIFKEREIYSTQYTQGSVTAEELENQEAIDITTRLATFPMVMIHSFIGCNCPDSVQLCRNRLVWADTNGKVYTMTAQSQYSERNVFEIGEMVERRLKNHDLSNARSVDWDGKYLLFVGNTAYVMDYNSYGFANIASYNKHEDANKLIPWYIWQLPFDEDQLIQTINANDSILCITNTWLGNINDIYRAVINYHTLTETITNDKISQLEYMGLEEDEVWQVNTYEKPVHSRFKTKLFDFGKPDEYKNVYAVNIAFGYNEGVPINVRFETNTGENDESTVKTSRVSANERTAAFFENKQIMPYSRLNTRIGIDVECNGLMSVDAISLKYNIAGGRK